ncbi:MAG: L-histidine N(alpha)-methyltransferase [bacterium]
MQLFAKKEKPVHTSFGPPYAVLNLSKVGLRYFRFMIKSSHASRDRLVQKFIDHPNVGWIFSAEGWFNLAVGVWAKDNAEINDISSSIRATLNPGDEIVYQSELTSLYGFGNRPVAGEVRAMAIVDAVYTPVDLDHLTFDYLKLVALDSSLPERDAAEILGITEEALTRLRSELEAAGVIVGYQDRLNYTGTYYKVFIDTLRAKTPDAVQKLTDRLWGDMRCIYIERANGKYDFEFELVLEHKAAIWEYVRDFPEHKIAVLTKNLYTNLYPLNKIANLREIKDSILAQSGSVIDLRNSKLWYLNPRGANAYLNIYENRNYFEAMEKSELDLFSDITAHIREKSGAESYSLIDIGSGDGLKARIFIEKLGEEKIKAYYPVDIQPIELAAALKSHAAGAYAKHPVLLDIENLSARFPLKLHPGEGQITIFLGGTYGNFKNERINAYLKPLLRDPSAVVLVSMPIVSGKTDADMIELYSGKQMEDMAFGPLLQIGFALGDFEANPAHPDLRIQPVVEDSRLVTTFTLKNDKIILGKRFDKGTVFKMTTSWKPTLEEVRAALERDFVIEKMFHNSEMSISIIRAK